MHFLYNNRLSSNWRGRVLLCLWQGLLNLGSAQKTGTPTAYPQLGLQEKGKCLFFPSVNVKEKSNNHKAVLMEVTQGFSCFV